MMNDDEIWSRWKFPADWSWKQSVINLARVIEREARQQALEDAASVCDRSKRLLEALEASGGWSHCSEALADAIRALKETA